MATLNPFDLLEDVESDDPSLLIAATEKKIAAKKAAAPAAAAPAPTSGGKLPTKPLPPAQAVKESRNSSAPARGGRGGGGRGGGRGGRGYGDRDRSYRDYSNTNGYARGPDAAAPENGVVAAGTEEGQGERGPRGPRGPYRGGPRRGYGNGEEGEEGRPRRSYDRHSGTGRGYGMKKDGAGRANWGTSTDENPAEKETEENVNAEEKPEKAAGQEDVLPSEEAAKEKEGDEAEKEKEEEDKEMTLEEYEKVLEEKRKALLALRAEERKVEVDKELQAMQVLSVKKNNDEVFIKLGADKESKKKETAEEKAKKSLSINEFLKPAEGESFYGRSRGRGGRGRGGDRGSFRGNRGPAAAPSIADQSQFPSLGGK